MKSSLFFALGLTGLFLSLPVTSQAEDWTTTDGKVYKDVAVVKAEPDAVTITHHDGGALVPLTNLSPDLQKRFGYDPVKAKAAADTRAQSEAKNAVVLQAEMDQAQRQKKQAIIASDPRTPQVLQRNPTGPYTASGTPFDPMGQPTQTTDNVEVTSETDSPSSIPSVPVPSPAAKNNSPISLTGDPLAPDPNDPRHHSMDSLVDINSRLKDDHPSPNRHTASSLLLASSYLMPDPLDPKHHSTDDLLKSASDLSKPNDSNHHSMDSLVNGDPLARP